MKEYKTTFAYIVEHMSEPSFEKVRNISNDFVQKLPSELVDELFEQLNRGVETLSHCCICISILMAKCMQRN